MLPNKLAFVDVETTGMRSAYDRIIEIGILRVEDGELVQTFKSLINPQTSIPREITSLTGITGSDLENAPTFRAIKDEIIEILADCTFVAHNVRFDYGFLKHELMRENITYNAKHFCTVRLSRLLYPQWPRHNLDAVIRECNLQCETRHRAFDDAQVLYEFYNHIQRTLPKEMFLEAIAKTMKKPSLPIKLPMEELEKLPDKPGVYIFYGADDKTTEQLKLGDIKSSETKFKTKNLIPLYVGKSINIRNRVLSHFSSDLASVTEMKISQQIESIETITTAGELGALFLESQMIKELLPIYNKRSRIKHELIALRSHKNKHGYNECYLEPITTITPENLENFLGFFRSRKQAKAFLADKAREFALCEKLLGLEKTTSACFAHRLERCKGACVNEERPEVYNLRFALSLSGSKVLPWPFKGPITIQEDSLEGKKEYFIIDNWCYIGNITVDAEGNMKDDIMKKITFDLDMYKILRQYLKNLKNRNKIANFTWRDTNSQTLHY
ncbi:MAG: DNA polymerase III subunit epsilon [Candidatus Levybacteria bacterium]|nr:DNA polymerase III subunit epsilon [Candidatus Levybacteria bacterium]